jgi:hypothetical protein
MIGAGWVDWVEGGKRGAFVMHSVVKFFRLVCGGYTRLLEFEHER